MKISVKKIHPEAIIPKRAHKNDAGLDIFCYEDFEIEPDERKSILTGIAIQIPEGYAGLIWEKSSLSHKYGLKLTGGVIDSGYRGEIQIGMINLSKSTFKFEKGHKIAQLLIQKIELPECIEVTNLEDSIRGEKGFGSTGK